ncbi:MAG: DUF1080 domain-containing protein [Prolixibacteraceae bacterium]|nr:DUF1080 domain-containing protein [Prolixibacteraceae bacterium]
MKKILLLAALVLPAMVFAQQKPTMGMKPEMTEIWEPEVKIVTPGVKYGDAPSDAIVLFDGKNLDAEWVSDRGGKPEWNVENGAMTVAPGKGGIKTKKEFGDFQLHIEWRSPQVVKGESQGRGNSGIFMQGQYEVQVLDSYENRTYRNGQAGSIYKQHPPLVNVTKAPGEWQTYDIIYTAPIFDAEGKSYLVPPKITLLHNGVVVQNASEVRGPTVYIGVPEYFVSSHGKGPISLQDHGDLVSFRNIWIREL